MLFKYHPGWSKNPSLTALVGIFDFLTLFHYLHLYFAIKRFPEKIKPVVFAPGSH